MRIENTYYETKSAIRVEAENKLENGTNWIYPNEAYRLGISDIADDVINEALEKLLADEKTREKLANEISRRVTKKFKDREAKLKADEKKNRQLWKKSKGEIPCLNQCGFVNVKTEEEVLHPKFSNNFVCKDCSDKLEAEGQSAFKIFGKINVYQIFGIE